MDTQYDVLIVGGCTAGLYFAQQMAKNGFKTLVIEKDSPDKHGKRYDIFHIAKKSFDRFQMEIPQKSDPDFVQIFSEARSRSALDNYPKLSSTEEIIVLHRHPFMKRLENLAIKQGVTVLHNTEFISSTFDKFGNLSGVKVKHNGDELVFEARLIADASGISSVVRSKLPDSYGIENFTISSKEKFFVVLYYVKLQNAKEEKLNKTCGWPYYKTWIAPQHKLDGAILGIGANYSYQYAEYLFEKFTKKITLPEYEIEYIEKGTTPYKRVPYSFVANNFICLGDAACLTNPWNGEGVTFGWEHAEIAASVISKVMKNKGIPTQDKLWKINKEYFNKYGAQNAYLLSVLASALDCTPQENDYEFQQSIIFENEGEQTKGNLFVKIIKGVFVGKIKFSTLKKIIIATINGQKILKHYQNYPDSLQKYETWVKKANKLWQKCTTIDQISEKDYHQFLNQ